MSISSLRFRPARFGIAAVLGAAVLSGCQQDMAQAPYYKPLEVSETYADDSGLPMSSSRIPVAGTVARGELRDDDELFTGKRNGADTDRFPVPISKELIERGMDRFNIYCMPCHGMTGDSNGMIVQRGLSRPPSFHIDRLTSAPVGHFYDVITNGWGRMSAYQHIHVRDRWAIAAYVKTLQYSQSAKFAELSEEDRKQVTEAAAAVSPKAEVPVMPASGGAH